MRNKKRWTAVLAAVLATTFMLQGTIYTSNEDMQNFVYPTYLKKWGAENKTGQRDSYYFDDAKSFKFKNLSNSKGGWFLNSGMPKSYYKKLESLPSNDKQVTGKYMSSSYGKSFIKKLKKYRTKNKYSMLINYDVLLGNMSYICKFGTKENLYTTGHEEYNFGIDFFQTGWLNLLDDESMMLTIKEMNQFYKKGYLKYSLYYGADKLKDKTINVGETVTNKPSNMPKSDWYDDDYDSAIIQEWNVYTPEEFNKAKKAKQTYLTWNAMHTDYKHNAPGIEKAYQVQNRGYNFDNATPGSDVASVDSKTGKVTGLKQGTAYVTVCYYEIQPVVNPESPFAHCYLSEYRYFASLKGDARSDAIKKVISKRFSEGEALEWIIAVTKATDDFPNSQTLVKFYRTYKVTVK